MNLLPVNNNNPNILSMMLNNRQQRISSYESISVVNVTLLGLVKLESHFKDNKYVKR